MRAIWMMYLNQAILELYKTYKSYMEKVWTGLLFQLQITLLIFQSTIP